jgi:hypothetical protein
MSCSGVDLLVAGHGTVVGIYNRKDVTVNEGCTLQYT